MIQYIFMDERHVPQIAQLEKICFSDPWSENSVAYELTNPLSLWLVAEEEGNVLGYVGSQSVMDESVSLKEALQWLSELSVPSICYGVDVHKAIKIKRASPFTVAITTVHLSDELPVPISFFISSKADSHASS